ncbi:hypothetical protein [Rhodanobacter sp. MP7CTX1]|uniref:hypothetical protein n=1 Tax=Rhodanobacter sp. MP7CTX1 TaxID=2723084 RepID=UPI00160B4D68|nr:hypothetical protein [Rhodanobacter sp. MP7CTX1]MBB6188009.1 hypothetical protein [Rhodanobacter sp. MP7CTX1]
MAMVLCLVMFVSAAKRIIKWRFSKDNKRSTSDLQSDGQPVGYAGQAVWRAWSTVLAMIGQQAGGLPKEQVSATTARVQSPVWLPQILAGVKLFRFGFGRVH